jgi:quinol monooxygenase YgiN
MSLPVLVGFAGVLVAAVATGLLAGRCARQPRVGFIVWTAATLALTIALAAQSMGFASGFGPATFRAVQLLALLLAPLWLAWGLVELAVGSDAARFGMRLVSVALSVVASVILATDPLTTQPFSKAWPLTGTHFQPVSRDALDVVQVVAVAVAVAIAGLAAVRAGRGPGPARDAGSARDLGPALTAIVPAALAVLAVLMTAGQRFPLPAKVAYPLLSIVAAVLVWFAVSRVGEVPRRAAGDGREEGMRDRRDKPGDEYWPDDRAAGEYAPEGQYVTYGQDRPGPGGPRGDFPGAPAGRGGAASGGAPAGRGLPGGDRGRRQGPQPRPPERPYRGSGPAGSQEPAADEWPGTQPVPLPGSEAGITESGLAGGAGLAGAAGLAGSPAGAATRPYGRILIFTLLEDRVTDFDRLAEEAAEYVRTGEPDTLVYVIHLVPNAPLQRIFYEIYRDRPAFDSHESQPYMQRFVAERRTCVLATNVIELRLKYAKVAPLPGPQPPAPVPVAPLPAAPPRGVPAAPVPQRARPLPPPRPQRSDQPRPGQPRYDRPRYEQPGYAGPGYAEPGYAETGYDQSRAGRERYDERRPDQRQIPSGRPYGG